MANISVHLQSNSVFPSAFSLDRLPNEILSTIFEHLSRAHGQQDIARLRLVCKLFAEIGNLYLLSVVHLFTKTSQFDQLRQISEHPTFSKKVNTLFYEANPLTNYDSMQDWRYEIGRIYKELPDPTSPPASERERRAYMRNWKKILWEPQYTYSEKRLRRAYARHKKYLAEQENIRLQDYNTGLLKDAMVKMPNLKTIEMSTTRHCSDAIKHAFKDALSAPSNDWYSEEGCGVGQLRALLLAADAVGLKFETLAARSVDWRFFRVSGRQNAEVLGKIQRSVRSLRTLSLYISTASPKQDDDEDPDTWFVNVSHALIPECFRYLGETSYLKEFITGTPYLERLDISFDSDYPYPPATLCDCVGTFKWHYLRVVAFAYISVDEDCLVRFFARHADTLRKLRLGNVFLTTGSWASLLQRACTTLGLEQAVFSGLLQSLDPEEAFCFWESCGKRTQFEIFVERYLISRDFFTSPPPLLDLSALGQQLGNVYEDSAPKPSEFVDRNSDEFVMTRYPIDASI